MNKKLLIVVFLFCPLHAADDDVHDEFRIACSLPDDLSDQLPNQRMITINNDLSKAIFVHHGSIKSIFQSLECVTTVKSLLLHCDHSNIIPAGESKKFLLNSWQLLSTVVDPIAPEDKTEGSMSLMYALSFPHNHRTMKRSIHSRTTEITFAYHVDSSDSE